METIQKREAWNKGRLVGQKLPLKPKDIWASDTGAIANKFGPKGALITGCVGFIALYFVIPALLHMWAENTKAKLSAGPVGNAMRQVLDEVFIRRFIHPSEWAGIAVLLLCAVIACWKALTRTDLDYQGQRDMNSLAKLIARFLD